MLQAQMASWTKKWEIVLNDIEKKYLALCKPLENSSYLKLWDREAMRCLIALLLILALAFISCTNHSDKTDEQPIIPKENSSDKIKDPTEILYDRIKALFQQRTEKSLSEAHELLLRHVQSNPQDAKAYLTLARIWEISTATESEQEKMREKYLKRALEIDPGNVPTVVDMVGVYFGRKQYKEAQKLLYKTIDIALAESNNFGFSTLYDFLGQSYAKSKQYDEARKAFKQSIKYGMETNPYGCPFQALGLLYAQMGKYEKTVELFDKAASVDQNSASYFQAALHHFNQWDIQKSEKYIQKAIEQGNDPKYDIIKAYILLMNRDYKNANTLLTELLNTKYKNIPPGVLIGLAHLEIVNQNYKKSMELIPDGYNLDKDFSLLQEMKSISHWDLYPWIIAKMAFLGRGWIHANQNRHAKAIKYFEKIIEEYPDDLLALLGLANSHLSLKHLDQAENIYSRILKKYPDNRYALAELATIHLSRGNEEDAERDFNRALAQDDKNFTCPYEELGLLYLKQGKMDEAAKNFEKAIEINPDVEFKKYNGLAKIRIEQGKYAEAKKLLEKSEKNYPHDLEAHNLLEKLKKLY